MAISGTQSVLASLTSRMASTPIATVEAVFVYPVKSMSGQPLTSANLGWHGFEGDRRFGLRRVGNHGPFPWLSASQLPELLLFTPENHEGAQDEVPTHIRTPDGARLPILGEQLASEIQRRYGAPVEMMQMKHGIFDDASISVIASDTIAEIGRLAGHYADIRRFRANVVVRMLKSAPFGEDRWVGSDLTFGDGAGSASVALTMRDLRCSMVNLDPDSAASIPEMMKAIVRAMLTTREFTAQLRRSGRYQLDKPCTCASADRNAAAQIRTEASQF